MLLITYDLCMIYCRLKYNKIFLEDVEATLTTTSSKSMPEFEL